MQALFRHSVELYDHLVAVRDEFGLADFHCRYASIPRSSHAPLKQLTPDAKCPTIKPSMSRRAARRHDVCPLCAQRRARRSCPALARTICPVCCGTKRRIEIQCPDDCSYLVGARTHPPAVLQRQMQRDAQMLGGMIRELSETQYRLLMLLQSTILRHRASAVPSLLDVDVADAAQALAATLESSDRGIIYDHRPTSLPGQRLATALGDVLKKVGRATVPRLDREAAVALRRLEAAARNLDAETDGGRTGYLDVLDRASRLGWIESSKEDADREPRLIIP